MENNKYIIREIQENEIDKANQLLNQLIIDEKKYDNNINENYIIKNYYQNRKTDSCIFVATLDNKIVAFLFGYIIEEALFIDRKAVLDALYVTEKNRKNGLANLLINSFKSWCSEKNIEIIEVTVCKNNFSAFNLYQKNGFDIFKYTMKLH